MALETLVKAVEDVILPSDAEPILETDLQEQVRAVLTGSAEWPVLVRFNDEFVPLCKKMFGADAYQKAYHQFLVNQGEEDSVQMAYLCTAVAWINTVFSDLDKAMQKRLRLTEDEENGQPARVLKHPEFAGIPTR